MTCVICRNGETHSGEVLVTLDRDQTVVVFRGVPAQVCENCREYYLSSEVTAKLLARAEEAARRGAEIEVIGFAA